jgi:mRNA interferase MazF
MAISTEAIKQDLDLLTGEQLQQIVDFIAFLRFRDQRRRMNLDPQQLALLSTEFAQEDSTLAEEGSAVKCQLRRGEVWLATLNPTQGSEQVGTRPVIIFQNDVVSRFSTTTIAIPLTTNLRRAALPICLAIEQGDGGLASASVALCFQMRWRSLPRESLDKTRLIKRLGQLKQETITQLEEVVLLTLGY